MSKSALYEEKRRPRIASPFGYSFLLVVVLILTFLLFAVLSLSSSLRDYKYSERAADKMSAYYEACNKANDVLAEGYGTAGNFRIAGGEGCSRYHKLLCAGDGHPGVMCKAFHYGRDRWKDRRNVRMEHIRMEGNCY